MFILGIIIHLTFLYSIFDIYFKSPIVKNVTPYRPQHHAVADRLVLFVVDGLRAESFVNYTTMKYLRSVANSNGRWGISHTQVPTESRPGHVALIAGFYEDPSAVFKGWKENPVDFDSVFNQSTYTWSWGTYDIVNIFTRGIADDHITVDDFDPYAQSFSTDKDTSQLDAWVFNKVKTFFNDAKTNADIQVKLKENKIVFFLHLLGTDTAGHTHKPKTSNFITTLEHVDQGIKEIEQVIRNYYGDDGKTTFLMTSDHGMTDWGSHGSGDNHETETPYVIWGSGIQEAENGELDSETLDMFRGHRLDINQIDMTPLMSTILSLPVPVNSIGKPINGLLNMALPDRAKAKYSIGRQLASQYYKKRQDIEDNALPMLYQPYEPFTKEKYHEIISFTEKLLEDKEYEELIVFSEEIVDLSLAGLRYYQDYYQKPLLILVTSSFLGWTVWLLRVLAEQKLSLQTESASRNRIFSFRTSFVRFVRNSVLFTVFVVGSYLVYAQNLPVQYYIYVHMPLILWSKALFPFNVWIYTLKQLKNSGRSTALCIEVFSYIVGSLALGMSFTYRWTLSIPLLGMGLWPLFSSARQHLSKPMVFLWLVGSLFLSTFAFIPVVGKDTFISLVLLAGFAWISFIFVYIYFVLGSFKTGELAHLRERKQIILQTGMLVLALCNITAQAHRFDKGTPVNYIDQAIAWIIAVISPIFPLLYSKRMATRLTAVNTSLITFYLLMSVAHEGLFIVALSLHVMSWIVIEYSLLNLGKMEILDCTFDSGKHKNINEIYIERSLTKHDFRRAFFFVCYIILAFFGTGNIASLNSFEVRWVTCFVTSFQPFLITTLVLLKTFAPFMVVGCGLVAMQAITEAPLGCLNIIVLVYSNFMGIQLLYYVRNTGSWLDIGTSISQFVIVQLITVFIVIINKIAKLYTDVSIAGRIYKNRKKYL